MHVHIPTYKEIEVGFKVVPKTETRVLKSMRLLPDTAEKIRKLTDAFNTTEGKLIDALMVNYYDVLIKEATSE